MHTRIILHVGVRVTKIKVFLFGEEISYNFFFQTQEIVSIECSRSFAFLLYKYIRYLLFLCPATKHKHDPHIPGLAPHSLPPTTGPANSSTFPGAILKIYLNAPAARVSGPAVEKIPIS